MNTLIRKPKPESAAVLEAELIDARAQYIEKRNSVVDRAVERRATVAETISDLQRESDLLTNVVDAARNDTQ